MKDDFLRMLPPPVPPRIASRSLLQRASSKINSNRLSFIDRWKSSSLIDLPSRRESRLSQSSRSSSSSEFNDTLFPSNRQLTASIKRKMVTSSLRNILEGTRTDTLGGMNRGSRPSYVLKPVTPPVVPGSRKEHVVQMEIGRKSTSSFPGNLGPESPGRDSLGQDSTVSCMTAESTSSGGYRNSFTSSDSRYSSQHRGIRQQSHHSSSSSSIVSGERGEDIISPASVHALMESGLPDDEILNAWLTDLNFEEYCHLFTVAGYDMPTISRMTPEDLTAIGIQKPNHRKKLKSEISKLNIADGLPNFIPESLEDWLHYIRLPEYGPSLRYQGYSSVNDVILISVEDLEDVGILKLGHQKRFLLAVKKVKDLKSGKIKPDFFQGELHRLAPRSPASSNNNMEPSSSSQTYQPEIIQIVKPIQPTRETSFSNLTQGFPKLQQQQQQHQNSAFSRHHYQINNVSQPMMSGSTCRLRSFDDSYSVLNPSAAQGVAHMHNGGGMTLPRPRGLVKPMPVARIEANFRDEDALIKEKQSQSTFTNNLEEHFGFKSRNEETNFQPNVQDTQSPTKTSAFKAPLPLSDVGFKKSAQQRSTGDVLNDIGSMLADLTDELDAMLHSERVSNNS